jgi:hypothetical protein
MWMILATAYTQTTIDNLKELYPIKAAIIAIPSRGVMFSSEF